MVGRLAYLWGWPLVNNFNRALAVKDSTRTRVASAVSIPAAPAGLRLDADRLHRRGRALRHLPQPGHRLRRRISAPRFQAGHRPGAGLRRSLLTYQIADARTDSFASIGKQYGTKPGFYLLVGPNWKGDMPAGINATSFVRRPISSRFSRASSWTIRRRTRLRFSRCSSQVMVYPLERVRRQDEDQGLEDDARVSRAAERRAAKPNGSFRKSSSMNLPVVMKQTFRRSRARKRSTRMIQIGACCAPRTTPQIKAALDADRCSRAETN